MKQDLDHYYKKGENAYILLEELFPIARSISGNGVRETLGRLKKNIPIDIHEVRTGYQAYDWTVPEEWNIKDAYVLNSDGEKIIDFKVNNLHVLYYSTPFNKIITLDELKAHTYSLPEQPELIPFVASYYKRQWGICMSQNQLDSLKEGNYKVVIDSTLHSGSLTYGEILIKGDSEEEIFFSTYTCHPSTANDNLSGVVVTNDIVEYLLKKESLRYSYRIVFIPETIGALVYMSKNLETLKNNVIAGYTVTCVGDPGNFSYLESKDGDIYVDKVSRHVLKCVDVNYKQYSFLKRGSDERQYSSHGADLPIGSIMRSKYHEYSEYHTSADNLNYVNEVGLGGSINVYQLCIEVYENNKVYESNIIGEAQLSSRNLYPDTFQQKQSLDVNKIVDFMAYANGINDLVDIANKIESPVWDLYPIIQTLLKFDLIKEKV